MKPLENLINLEKARLLHELFPQENTCLIGIHKQYVPKPYRKMNS